MRSKRQRWSSLLAGLLLLAAAIPSLFAADSEKLRVTFTNEVGQVFKDAEVVAVQPDGIVYRIPGKKLVAGFVSYKVFNAETLKLLQMDPEEAKAAEAARQVKESITAATREAEESTAVNARRAKELRPTLVSSSVVGNAFQGLIRNNAPRPALMTVRAAIFDAAQNPLGTIEVAAPRAEPGRPVFFRQLLTAGSSARVTEIVVNDGIADAITFQAEGGYYAGTKRPTERVSVPITTGTNAAPANALPAQQ